jgi:plastocyanin
VRPGTTIELTWENFDGKRHKFVIQNSLGETLVESAESASPGEMQTVTFEASQEMTTYLDPRYPVQMRGELLVTPD